MKKGVFIAFEGLDGSGKTTQFNAIINRLAAKKINCIAEKQPSNCNPIGLLLRDIVKNAHDVSLSPLSLAKLFSIDRYEHVVNNIKPHIDAGRHVLIDRYVFSSFAYQGQAFTFDEIYSFNRDAIELLMPDLTIFIDTTPEECTHRIASNRASQELFDDNGIVIRNNFYNAFEKMKTSPTAIINGNQPTDAVTDEIWKAVEPLFEGGLS